MKNVIELSFDYMEFQMPLSTFIEIIEYRICVHTTILLFLIIFLHRLIFHQKLQVVLQTLVSCH